MAETASVPITPPRAMLREAALIALAVLAAVLLPACGFLIMSFSMYHIGNLLNPKFDQQP